MNVLNNRHHHAKMQSGINMVDLMMWLVIAALLLAAALQGIGYYQKAAHLSNMKSDLAGAGSLVMSAAATNGGVVTVTAANEGVAKAKWSEGVIHTVGITENGTPYLRATHPSVEQSDAVYLFEACSTLDTGVNVVTKGNAELEADCGIEASSPTVPSIDFSTLTWTTVSTGSSTWEGMEMSADGSILVGNRNSYTSSYVSQPNSLFFSTDSGATWTKDDGLSGSRRSTTLSDDGTTLLSIVDGSAVRSSTNLGETWVTAKVDGTYIPNESTWVGAISADGNKLFAAGSSGSSINTYYSLDSGATWHKNPSLPTTLTPVYMDASADGSTIMFGTAGAQPRISTNYGQTWETVTGLPNGGWYDIDISSDSTHIVAANFDLTGGVWISNDSGANWEKTNLPETRYRSVAISTDGQKIVATQNGGYLYTSTDGGTTWIEQTDQGIAGAGWRVDMSDDGSRIIAGGPDGKVILGKYGE